MFRPPPPPPPPPIPSPFFHFRPCFLLLPSSDSHSITVHSCYISFRHLIQSHGAGTAKAGPRGCCTEQPPPTPPHHAAAHYCSRGQGRTQDKQLQINQVHFGHSPPPPKPTDNNPRVPLCLPQWRPNPLRVSTPVPPTPHPRPATHTPHPPHLVLAVLLALGGLGAHLLVVLLQGRQMLMMVSAPV